MVWCNKSWDIKNDVESHKDRLLMTDRVYLSHGGMKASIYFTEVHPPNPF